MCTSDALVPLEYKLLQSKDLISLFHFCITEFANYSEYIRHFININAKQTFNCQYQHFNKVLKIKSYIISSIDKGNSHMQHIHIYIYIKETVK